MANPNKVIGQAKVSIDGTRIATSGETTLMIGGATRENVPGDYDAGSFRETIAPARAEIGVLTKAATDLANIRNLDNATVTIEFDNGQSWLMRNAYSVEPSSIGQDGKSQIIFEGPPAERIL